MVAILLVVLPLLSLRCQRHSDFSELVSTKCLVAGTTCRHAIVIAARIVYVCEFSFIAVRRKRSRIFVSHFPQRAKLAIASNKVTLLAIKILLFQKFRRKMEGFKFYFDRPSLRIFDFDTRQTIQNKKKKKRYLPENRSILHRDFRGIGDDESGAQLSQT